MEVRRVDHHFYTLRARDGSGRERTGALLRFDFSSGAFGYADCHPWVELGDLTLADQLKGLKDGVLTPLTRSSLFFAQNDAAARAQGKSLFQDLSVPKSHAFVGGPENLRPGLLTELRELGFERLKLKTHRAEPSAIRALASLRSEFKQTGLRLRLDFNQSLSRSIFEEFMDELLAKALEPEMIDWLEDPSQENASNWNWILSRWNVRLAQDRAEGEGAAVAVRVVKPAVQDSEAFLKAGAALCVTSYLDHPFGQLCAAWSAARLSRSRGLEDCGLVSHQAYERNPFSEQFESGPFLKIPGGTGFGFDSLLRDLPWEIT